MSFPAELAGQVHVYQSNISNTFDAQPTTWHAGLAKAGDAWTLDAAGLVVRLERPRALDARLRGGA